MASIVHLRKRLHGPPVAIDVPGVEVRQLQVPDEVEDWLALRARAIVGLVPAPRPWMHADYQSEMYDKPWWRTERNWVAISPNSANNPVGAVTLAVREGAATSVAVVHWLLVDPAWRRRGIARLLMAHLEQTAWDAGWHEVQLETHGGWAPAVAFYHSIGFESARDPSPR